MSIPTLKRVKIASAQELRSWLVKNQRQDQPVMVVTVADPKSRKHVSRESIVSALADHGWHAGASYTLNGGLRGAVIQPKDAKKVAHRPVAGERTARDR